MYTATRVRPGPAAYNGGMTGHDLAIRELSRRRPFVPGGPYTAGMGKRPDKSRPRRRKGHSYSLHVPDDLWAAMEAYQNSFAPFEPDMKQVVLQAFKELLARAGRWDMAADRPVPPG